MAPGIHKKTASQLIFRDKQEIFVLFIGHIPHQPTEQFGCRAIILFSYSTGYGTFLPVTLPAVLLYGENGRHTRSCRKNPSTAKPPEHPHTQTGGYRPATASPGAILPKGTDVW